MTLVGWIETDDDAGEEARLHLKYASRNIKAAETTSKEWFWLQPADILDDLQRAGQAGFVVKNADAFEITGYDKDAVPEYLGVWDWGSLEIHECCPFCGCLCGMHFQDASYMYYCVNCQMLTDFSEGQPGGPQFDPGRD